jgi:hypothetical protein
MQTTRLVLVLIALALPFRAPLAADEPALPAEQQIAFLKAAKVVRGKPIGKGVTGALRLTLSDGRLTHDAAFQSVDQRTTQEDLRTGRRRAGELLFADSYHYNIAAWELARLLNLDGMMPATIERTHDGQRGALSWWVDDVMMDEAERERTSAVPPDGQSLVLVQQQQRMQVFAELVQDTDRNKGNVIYTNDWRLIMLDFTRAFRTQASLRLPAALNMCDRSLLARLRSLTKQEVARASGSHLNPYEVDAMMKRRDLIVEHFDRLVKERGEAAVLF